MINRFKNSIIGAMTGDAMNYPTESNSRNAEGEYSNLTNFVKWEATPGGRFYRHVEPIEKGEYSDDAQLMLCTARSLLRGDMRFEHMGFVELPMWLSYERGGGRACKAQAKTLMRGILPWETENTEQYYNAGGNGAVMRVLPHLFACNPDLYHLQMNVFEDTVLTHGGPMAIQGALTYITYMYLLVSAGFEVYETILDDLVMEMDRWRDVYYFSEHSDRLTRFSDAAPVHFDMEWETNLDAMMDSICTMADYTLEEYLVEIGTQGKGKGRGDVTAIAAITLSLAMPNIEEAMNYVSSMKDADNDTLACVMGGIHGLMYEELPTWMYGVQDAEYAMRLVYFITKGYVEPYVEPSKRHQKLKDTLLTIGRANESLPNFKRLKVLKQEQLTSLAIQEITVVRYKLLTEEGQTIYIKYYKKG